MLDIVSWSIVVPFFILDELCKQRSRWRAPKHVILEIRSNTSFWIAWNYQVQVCLIHVHGSVKVYFAQRTCPAKLHFSYPWFVVEAPKLNIAQLPDCFHGSLRSCGASWLGNECLGSRFWVTRSATCSFLRTHSFICLLIPNIWSKSRLLYPHCNQLEISEHHFVYTVTFPTSHINITASVVHHQ